MIKLLIVEDSALMRRQLVSVFDAEGDFYKAGLMNFMLGGTFNSHLNMNLRENKGWTYGVRSGFSGTKYRGPFSISGGFKKEATDSTLTEIFKELNNYQSNLLTEEEVQFTKNSINQSEALRYETLSQKAGILFAKQRYELDPEYKMNQLQILMSLDAKKINTIAHQLLELNQMIVVVVGDRKTVKEKLGAWGYPVIELDSEGNPVKQ